MPLLREIHPDGTRLLEEIEEFRRFLATNPRGERSHFLPFFAGHLQLCAYLGTLNDRVRVATHVGTEVSLWGDFSAMSLPAILKTAPSYSSNSKTHHKTASSGVKRAVGTVIGARASSTAYRR